MISKLDFMKFRYAFFLLTVFALISSCGKRYSSNPTILRAESLLYTHPDSAYLLLTGIDHPKQLPEADYAAWCLHYSHACYKLQKTQQYDSIIRFAVDYYKNSGLHKYSGTAYYVQGRFMFGNRPNNETLTTFKNAELELEKTNENNLKGLVEYNIPKGFCFDIF